MTDLLLERVERLVLLCCVLALATLIGWGSLAYTAWSGRDLSRQLSTQAAEVSELIAQRNDARTTLDQLQQSAAKDELVKRIQAESRESVAKIGSIRR